MTPEQDLIYKIVETWGNAAISFQEREQWLKDYAKQQAISFDIWKRENCITYDYDNKAYCKLVFLDVDHTRVRTEQLSIDETHRQFIDSQFIEQQNK